MVFVLHWLPFSCQNMSQILLLWWHTVLFHPVDMGGYQKWEAWEAPGAQRHSNVLVLLLSCAPQLPIPLYILVRASLRCSVMGVEHSVLWDLQFLGNFPYWIALISQNKNRLTSFRRKLFVSGSFEPVIAQMLMLQILNSSKEGQFYCFLNQYNSFQLT
jgi:hypothetical protein